LLASGPSHLKKETISLSVERRKWRRLPLEGKGGGEGCAKATGGLSGETIPSQKNAQLDRKEKKTELDSIKVYSIRAEKRAVKR